jgi:hypothetical protein
MAGTITLNLPPELTVPVGIGHMVAKAIPTTGMIVLPDESTFTLNTVNGVPTNADFFPDCDVYRHGRHWLADAVDCTGSLESVVSPGTFGRLTLHVFPMLISFAGIGKRRAHQVGGTGTITAPDGSTYTFDLTIPDTLVHRINLTDFMVDACVGTGVIYEQEAPDTVRPTD